MPGTNKVKYLEFYILVLNFYPVLHWLLFLFPPTDVTPLHDQQTITHLGDVVCLVFLFNVENTNTDLRFVSQSGITKGLPFKYLVSDW